MVAAASALLVQLLSAVGAVATALVIARLAHFVRLNMFTTCDLKRRYAKAGEWALVTGASEGIGHAMAMDLARRGFNVCVIARTQARLDELVKEMREAAGVQGMAIAFDFANATAEQWSELFARLDSIAIAVLINNVGINYEMPRYFDEAELDLDLRILKVCCETTMRMTKYVLPKMRARRNGAIVNLASIAATSASPFFAVYSGAKSFNYAFSESLACEVAEFGIDVLAVTPNLVVSRMTQGVSSRKPRETFIMVNADAMAHQTLNKLGSTWSTSGHCNHAIIEAIYRCIPLSLRSAFVLKQVKSVKSRAERRQQNGKKQH